MENCKSKYLMVGLFNYGKKKTVYFENKNDKDIFLEKINNIFKN